MMRWLGGWQFEAVGSIVEMDMVLRCECDQ
jgi:hypothetical protein